MYTYRTRYRSCWMHTSRKCETFLLWRTRKSSRSRTRQSNTWTLLKGRLPTSLELKLFRWNAATSPKDATSSGLPTLYHPMPKYPHQLSAPKKPLWLGWQCTYQAINRMNNIWLNERIFDHTAEPVSFTLAVSAEGPCSFLSDFSLPFSRSRISTGEWFSTESLLFIITGCSIDKSGGGSSLRTEGGLTLVLVLSLGIRISLFISIGRAGTQQSMILINAPSAERSPM